MLNEFIRTQTENLIRAACPDKIEADIWNTHLRDHMWKINEEWPGVDFYANMVEAFLNIQDLSIAQQAILQNSSSLITTLIQNSTGRITNIMHEMLRASGIKEKELDRLTNPVVKQFMENIQGYADQFNSLVYNNKN